MLQVETDDGFTRRVSAYHMSLVLGMILSKDEVATSSECLRMGRLNACYDCNKCQSLEWITVASLLTSELTGPGEILFAHDLCVFYARPSSSCYGFHIFSGPFALLFQQTLVYIEHHLVGPIPYAMYVLF